MLPLQESRTAAMRQVISIFQSAEGVNAAKPSIKSLWQKILALLGDPAPSIRQLASVALGLIGAMASKTTSGTDHSVVLYRQQTLFHYVFLSCSELWQRSPPLFGAAQVGHADLS